MNPSASPPFARRLALVLLALVAAAVVPGAARALERPGPSNVVVLANSDVAGSLAVAAAYLAARGLGDDQLCALPMPSDYAVAAAAFEAQVKAPFAACLAARGLQEQALFVAVAWGVPGVITDAGAEVMGARTKALDAFLADPFDEIAGDANPYFHRTEAFTRENGFRGYLVTRLDGPGADVALDLVRRAVSAELAGEVTGGVGYFDLEPHGDNAFDQQVIAAAGPTGNAMIQHAHDLVAEAGFDVILDANDAEFGTAPAPLGCPDARWYFGWYRLNHYNDAFAWRSGALGVHLDSFSAREFRKAGAWVPGALAHGLTATAGAVWEPYLDGFLEGDTFFEAFVADGVSLAEAAYRAIPRLEWMMVVFGDPLFSLRRTYPGTTLPPGPEPTPEPAQEPGPERIEASGEQDGGSLPETVAEPLPETVAEPGEPSPGGGGCALGPGAGSPASGWPIGLALVVGALVRARRRPGVVRAPAASSRRSTRSRSRRCRRSRRIGARRRAPRQRPRARCP